MNQVPKEWILIIAGFVLMGSAFFGVTRITNVSEGTLPPTLPSANSQAAQQSSASASNASRNNGARSDSHVVQAGETLQGIANQYGVTMDELVLINGIADPNVLSMGQRLYLPTTSAPVEPQQQQTTVSLIIPDSELVFGPTAQGFDLREFVPQDAYLRRYQGEIEGVQLDGLETVQLVAERSRVHPRLLLAALEHRAGWVTKSNPSDTSGAMMGNNTGQQGLYRQLEWAANQMNFGYYGRSEGGLGGVTLASGERVAFSAEINDGTAGVQHWLAATSDLNRWQTEISPDGFLATYKSLFGDPFAYADDNFWPPTAMPEMSLPWASGEEWFITGGPHGGWISGSGWAALDFVPPGDQLGCYESAAWLTAVADGIVTRSNFGAVVLDLDGDGYAGTGWAILYQHVATNERAQVGTQLKRGQPLGHPSCEGGFSSGTHLHIARTYNGRWVSADKGNFTFNLAGWVSSGVGNEYNGILQRNGISKTATIGRLPENAISE